MAETATLSASVAAMSLSDSTTLASDRTQALKPNLPLPRELRDKIWGYLLYHEHIHTAPYSEQPQDKKGEESEKHNRSISRAHTFKFHTNVLAVNHQIYEEAFKVLKSNDFVLITYGSTIRGISKHENSLPVVTENLKDCASFENRIMSIDLQAAMCMTQEDDGTRPEGSFIIVAADLPRFCRMLQNALYAVPAMANYVYNAPDNQAVRKIEFGAGADGQGIDFTTYIKIRLQEGQVSFDKATKFLDAFQCVVHPNLQISVFGYPKGIGKHVTKLKKVMAPKAVWIKAMAWHIIEYCQWELGEAKASAEAGDLEHAVRRFSGVVGLHNLMPLFKLPIDEFYASDAAIPAAILGFTILDAGVTENNLRIRLRGTAYDTTSTILSPLDSLCTFLIGLPFSVLSVSLSTLGYKLGRAPPPPICRVVIHEWMMGVSKENILGALHSFDSNNSTLQGDAYFEHDYALVKKLSEDEKLRSKVLSNTAPTSELLALIAATQLPVQIYLNPLFEVLKQPNGMEGFVDVAKRAEMQKRYPGKYDDL